MFGLLVAFALAAPGGAPAAHVWEKQEITLTAQKSYPNPYLTVDVWVDLAGPGFKKRVYGFWDGGNTYRVRVVATAPGVWSWSSGSNLPDPGLNGKTGSFRAVAWSQAERKENPARRGFIRATPNGHAFQYADGTPYFLLGDTWWALGTFRFPWTEGDATRPVGPNASFKDYIALRKSQGFNAVGMIAAFPAWANDGKPNFIRLQDAERTTIRAAWLEQGTKSAKDMHNEGGRPFLFPGRVPGYEDLFPDVDRINPAYFQHIDKKIDYLNSQGFVVFLEVARRDLSKAWKKFYKWPDSYARYIQYVWARYQANNMLFSPIHFDTPGDSIPASDYKPAVNMVRNKYGPPPFGTLVSTNSNPSSLVNFGEGEDAKWMTFYQTGNAREHDFYWYLTEEFFAKRTLPALNGEPYYSGYAHKDQVNYKYGAPGGTARDSLYVRSAMYGSFLSGGLAGHLYGSEGIWGADTEPGAEVKMWDAFRWDSANYMQHLRTFAFSQGKRYQDLVPSVDLVTPNRTHNVRGFEEWAYCARTKEKDLFFVYYEKGCPADTVRGAIPDAAYEAKWFNPRTAEWSDVGSGTLKANVAGRFRIPPQPSKDDDWGLRLVLKP